MPRLIDADEAKRCAKEYFDDPVMLLSMELILDISPTVDAVEVVRCRDCKHCDPENHHCDHHMGTAAPLRRKHDDFCSYGERKEGNDNGA